MSQQQTSAVRPRHLAPAILALTLACALTLLAGCGGSQSGGGSSSNSTEIGGVKIGLNDPLVRTLGRIEGPFTFIKCFSPSVVQLATVPEGKTEAFSMVGLADEPYPDAKPDKDHPIQDDEATKQRKRAALKIFKVEGLKKIFEEATKANQPQVWVVRLTKANPKALSKVYMFIPDSNQIAGKPLSGEALVVNAQALRRGVANMDLTNPAIMALPLADQLMDCQISAIVDAKRNKFGGADVWTQYPMQLPKGPFQNRLAEIEKRM